MKILLLFIARYLLAPFSIAIMVFALTTIKKIKSRLNIKKIIVFLLIATLILSIPCLFGFLKNEYVWGGLFFTILTYLLLGYVFSKLLTAPLFTTLGFNGSRKGTLIIIAVLCISGGWCHFLLFELISKLPYSFMCSLNIIWFAVPSFILFSRESFLKIPQPIYTPWELSCGTFDRNYWDNIAHFGSRSVTVKIKRKIDDASYATLVVRMPNEISLGNWFNWFIEDQNRRFPQDLIEIQDGDYQIGWMFLSPRWFRFPLFIRTLDPYYTSEQNKIKNHQIIYIHRVKTTYQI